MPGRRSFKLLVLVACAALIAAFAEPPARRRTETGRPLLPRLEFLRIFGASQLPLVTTYFWLETLQCIGGALTEQEYRDVYDYANLVTDLDPHLYVAYTFAGLTISFNRGRETWVNTAESTAILEKGLRAFPYDTSLKGYLAYNLVYFHKEYRRAGLLLREVAGQPGVPTYVGPLATRLLAQAGDFDSGLALAETLRDSAADPEARAAFARRVKEIELERVLQGVDRANDTYRQRQGHPATTVAQLLTSGDLGTPPVDPLGGTISIGDDGRAHSSSERNRLELNLDQSNIQTNTK